MGLLDQLAISGLTLLPRPIMRRFAERYIAGESLEEALAAVAELEGRGYGTILDILGEDVEDESQARAVAASYVQAAERLKSAGHGTYVSIKPTHVGLSIAEELAFELYLEVARRCRELGVFVRVEMEDHSTTDATLRVFERLRGELDNVGIVLQSRLLRTLEDVDRLVPASSTDTGLNVRLVKGIYLEPRAIAHVAPDPIRDAFFEIARRLFERGSFVSLATHDDGLARRLFELRPAPDRYELQVLLGVRRELWRLWREEGHPVRVYVPFGPQWRPYSLRRLRKNPQIFRHVLRDTFARGG